MEILDLATLPLYNQDIELDAPQEVVDFKTKVKEADAVLWVTPQYNATIPGVLGIAIDWLSRVDKVMNGKPSIIMGSSGNFRFSQSANALTRHFVCQRIKLSCTWWKRSICWNGSMRNLMLKVT